MPVTQKKTLLTLPQEVADAYETIENVDVRSAYLTELRGLGWTLQSLAAVAKVTRERVRQITGKTWNEDLGDLPLPAPPQKPAKPKPVYVEPEPETLARLLELQPLAQKVRSNSPAYREESEEYTKLLAHAHAPKEEGGEGVTLYRLAKRLGVTHGALRFRLVRYGYKEPTTGTSRVYAPILEKNRVKSS